MMRLGLLLGILAVGLALLIFNHDGGRTFGLGNEDFGQIVYLAPIAILIGAGILTSRQKLGRNLAYLAAWAAAALVLVTIYVYRDQAAQMTSRVAAELMPGHSVVLTGINGQNEVVIRRTRDGHFAINAEVDGHRLGMLVDTGASQVALTFEDAERIGLEPDKLKFTLPITTANGTATAAAVKIATLSIGPIVRHNVSATVAQAGRLDSSLLGMNFLSSLSAIRMEPGEMRLMD
jgi:aspartyl protease family protein